MSEKNNKKRTKNDSALTDSVHAGFNPDFSEGSAVMPTYGTTTYVFPSAQAGEEAFIVALSGGEPKHLIYGRLNHPGAEILEKRLAALECKGAKAVVASSGMAVINLFIFNALFNMGIKKICHTNPIYGGTYDFFYKILKNNFSIHSFDNEKDFLNIYKNSEDGLGVVYIESPANPTMTSFDIKTIAEVAKSIDPNCLVVVDNTFLGLLQKPLEISDAVDAVLYSATKFIGGHSDVLAGVVISKNLELINNIKGLRVSMGNILAPQLCDLLLRSLPTYGLRMRQQQKNAKRVVNFLENHSQIEKVFYPGKGSILAFTLKGVDKEKTFAFLDCITSDHIISQAVSLGGIEALITHPRTTTHSEMPVELLDKLGITDNFIRLSVGLEDPVDIINRFKKGFKLIK